MGRFFLAGTDPAGRRRTESVEAPSAAAALAELAGRGWRDAELLTDGIMANVSTPAVEAHRPLVEKTFDPEEQVGFLRGGLAWQLWMLVRKGGWVVLAVIAYFAWRRLSGVRWTGWDHFLLLAILVIVASTAAVFWSSGRYRRMLLASAAGRWEDALRRVDRLERSSLGKLIPPLELGMRRANALLGLGREMEALAVIARLDRSAQPEWMFEGRLGELHARRRRLDEALACYRRSVDVGGEQAETHLALAEYLAGFLARDAAGAAAALARARAFPIARSIEWAVERVEAMIAVEEGRYEAALQHLARARSSFLANMADAGLHRGFLAHIAAYAAIALGGLGRHDEARDVLRRADVARWLTPTMPELLARAYDAAGIAGRV
jgi:tetratricopeptide (TPR) repeat protein